MIDQPYFGRLLSSAVIFDHLFVSVLFACVVEMVV